MPRYVSAVSHCREPEARMELLIVPLIGSRSGEHTLPGGLVRAHPSGPVPRSVAARVVRGGKVPVVAGRAT